METNLHQKHHPTLHKELLKMKNIMYRIRNRKGFTLVELMIVVAIIGILAAIAIPAFLRAVKKSKTSEADGNVKKMIDGAKSYFTSEQKHSLSATSGGDQPWHPAGAIATNDAAGFPVTWANYSFPGGGLADAEINTDSAATASQLSVDSVGTISGQATNCTITTPQGGAKVVPFGGTQPAATSNIAAVLNKLNVTFQDPLYFQYHYNDSGRGPTAAAVAAARADFKTGSNCHTLAQAVTIDPVSQEVVIIPSITFFEFE